MKNFIEKHLNKINIGLIVLIAIAPLLLCFNSSLWFDEAYSVGIAKQPWGNLFISTINDVHPILYYVLLRIDLTDVLPVNVAIHGTERTECRQLLRHFQRTDVTGMPDFITRFEILQILFIPISVCIG